MSGRDWLAGLIAATAVAAAATPARADEVAVIGATVHPTPETTIEHATIVIRDGKIVAIGADVAVPAKAKRIDATGKIVTAGLIETSTRMGLVEINLEDSTVAGQFGSRDGDGDDGVHAAYRAIDGYNASAVAIPVARTGGVTSVVTSPTGGLVAGSGAWYTLADGVTADDAALPAAAMYASIDRDAAGGGERSRGAAIERLRELLDDVAAYARNKAGYERNQSRALTAERLDLDALIPVVRGRMPLVIAADRESDIRAALRLAKDLSLRLVIQGGTEAWRVAAALAKAKVPVIINPTFNLPESFDTLQVRDDNAKLLVEAGVAVGISTLGDASQARNLRQLAGVAVGNGLAWADGLAALTTVPAQAFGMTGRGALTVGAAADLVIWSGDPLELSSRAEVVIIGGVEQSLVTRQSKLLERYRHLP